MQKSFEKKIIIVLLTLELVGINNFVVTVGYRGKFGIIWLALKALVSV